MRPRNGFTLAEILVALVVLQVGMLGTVGTLVLATSTLTRARDLEWAVHQARALADSLALFGAAGSGNRDLGFGSLDWSTSSSADLVEVRIQVRRNDAPEVPLLEATALVLPERGGEP